MNSHSQRIPPAALDALTDALHPDPFYAALTPEATNDPATWREQLHAYFA